MGPHFVLRDGQASQVDEMRLQQRKPFLVERSKSVEADIEASEGLREGWGKENGVGQRCAVFQRFKSSREGSKEACPFFVWSTSSEGYMKMLKGWKSASKGPKFFLASIVVEDGTFQV